MVALVAVLVGVVAAIALLSGRDDRMGLAAAATDESAPPSPVTLDGPLVTEPTGSATTMPDIIPGFPYTDDIEIFLQQLEADPDLVGEKGEDLVEKLAELLNQNSPKKQRDQAKELREEIADWVDEADLDPAIAEALDKLLEEEFA